MRGVLLLGLLALEERGTDIHEEGNLMLWGTDSSSHWFKSVSNPLIGGERQTCPMRHQKESLCPAKSQALSRSPDSDTLGCGVWHLSEQALQ